MDNILIHQKDHIRGLILDEKFAEARKLLDFIKELWFANTYGYKWNECVQVMRDSLDAKIRDADHWKQRQHWTAIRAFCC